MSIDKVIGIFDGDNNGDDDGNDDNGEDEDEDEDDNDDGIFTRLVIQCKRMKIFLPLPIYARGRMCFECKIN